MSGVFKRSNTIAKVGKLAMIAGRRNTFAKMVLSCKSTSNNHLVLPHGAEFFYNRGRSATVNNSDKKK